MVVATATPKSPTGPHHPAPGLHQAAPGSGMTVFVGILNLPSITEEPNRYWDSRIMIINDIT